MRMAYVMFSNLSQHLQVLCQFRKPVNASHAVHATWLWVGASTSRVVYPYMPVRPSLYVCM